MKSYREILSTLLGHWSRAGGMRGILEMWFYVAIMLWFGPRGVVGFATVITLLVLAWLVLFPAILSSVQKDREK